MSTGSVGWKTRARTASKWDRNVYFAFHVFLKLSLVVVTICMEIFLVGIFFYTKHKTELSYTYVTGKSNM